MTNAHLTSDARVEYAATIADHRRLIPLLEEFEEWLDATHDAAALCQGLEARLSHIYARLVPHFRREEQGPLFKEIPILHPRFAKSLMRLLDEHTKFIDEAQMILRTVQDKFPSPECVRETSLRARLLVASLRRHESEENEILQRTYCEDIGTKD